MTCHELRVYFDDPLRMDSEHPGAVEHLAQCAECARFVEARCELGAGLRLLGESSAEPSAALEAAVLANYRRQVTGHLSVARSRRGRFTAVCWTAAAAATLALVAALLFHPARTVEISHVEMDSPLPASGAQPVTSTKTTNRVPWTNTASSPKSGLLSAKRSRRAPQLETAKNLASEDFRSLMYCDPLSCGGAMQLIRVQLPSSAAAFESVPASADGAIYADVLVGSDGIARGIRVVQ